MLPCFGTCVSTYIAQINDTLLISPGQCKAIRSELFFLVMSLFPRTWFSRTGDISLPALLKGKVPLSIFCRAITRIA